MVNLFKNRHLRQGLGLFARLRGDIAANVLAITAACLPPILVLVGGAVDMSRAYMTQTALQNACDAGVLAGRRASAKSGTFGSTEQAKATRMFDFDFDNTLSSSAATGTTFTPTDSGNGVISATASTTMPTTIMKMFGKNSFALSTTCSAEFQVSNIDVMMVLDTTGSMACNPDGSNCTSSPTSKIEGLKSAIRSFYTTIATAVPSGGTTRIRFAFVPYNSTVNMRNLASGASPVITQSYLASSANYQTRLYHFDQAVRTATVGSPVVTTETSPTDLTQADCTTWANASSTTTGTSPNPVTTTTYALQSWTKNCGSCTGNQGSGKGNLPTGICIRTVTSTTTTYPITSYALNTTTPYRYTQAALNTTNLKAFSAVPIATEVASNASVPAAGYTTGYYDPVTLGSLAGTTGVTAPNVTWNGCIEERSTVNTLFTSNTVPTGALDHDVVSAPTTTAATQWKPFVDQLEWNRGQSATLDTDEDKQSEWDRQLYDPYWNITDPYRLCAPAAMNFTTVDTSAPNTVPSWIQTFLGTLVANGNTYHDIGMIWGARLASTTGINSAVVNAAPPSGGTSAVSRHIIFLTDGETAPNTGLYNSYGLEAIDNRVAPAGSGNNTLKDYHNARYTTACQTAKNMGYTVWVIGFGQALTTPMTTCASAGKAYFASDNATLQSTFRQIAGQVADLRLKS